MPQNFPEAWLRRVITNLTTVDVPTWMDGIAELDVTVTEGNSGDESEFNTFHLPTSVFQPSVLINNTTYPLALEAYNDSKVDINLDKYDTAQTTLSDDQTTGAAYRQIDFATGTHTDAINEKKYAKALHAVPPDDNTQADKPVLLTTGDAVATGTGMRLRARYEDIVALGAKADKLKWPKKGRRLVLSDDHKNDLLLDRKNFGDIINNYKTGDPAPIIAGWEIHWDIINPYYTGTTKVPFASVPGASSFPASVAFMPKNIAKKTGNTKNYFSDSKTDTATHTNKFNVRHYFIFVPMLNKYRMALASGVSS